MNSPGHRANILACGTTTIGVGLDTRGWYWTQNFGRRVADEGQRPKFCTQ